MGNVFKDKQHLKNQII